MTDQKRTNSPPISVVNTPSASDTVLASFIWKNAEDLWGDFKHTDFGKIILPFYNTSQYSLATLGATKTKSNLEAYIAGFSDDARVIFDQFNFFDTIARVARAC